MGKDVNIINYISSDGDMIGSTVVSFHFPCTTSIFGIFGTFRTFLDGQEVTVAYSFYYLDSFFIGVDIEDYSGSCCLPYHLQKH